jgi:hypothetical protein
LKFGNPKIKSIIGKQGSIPFHFFLRCKNEMKAVGITISLKVKKYLCKWCWIKVIINAG